jgi:hypothetical protein
MKKYPAVNVFIAGTSRMGCQLIIAALCRSRYKLAVVGYATISVPAPAASVFVLAAYRTMDCKSQGGALCFLI